jgi:undecaprenyl-diphosphatase
MQALNLSLFQWLAAGQSPNPQLLWFASLTAVQAVWLCALLVGWIFWRYPAQRSYTLGMLAAAAVATVLAHVLARALDVPRPFVAGLSPAYINHGARGSLPSAHAAVMFTLALICCLRPAIRKVGITLFVIALATGWARIYVGVHFPLDILAGFALAFGITAVFWALVKLTHRLTGRDGGKAHGSAIRTASQD